MIILKGEGRRGKSPKPGKPPSNLGWTIAIIIVVVVFLVYSGEALSKIALGF